MELQLHHIRANKHKKKININNLFLITPIGRRGSIPLCFCLNQLQNRSSTFINKKESTLHCSPRLLTDLCERSTETPQLKNKCKDMGNIDHSHAVMILTISSQFKSLPPHNSIYRDLPPTITSSSSSIPNELQLK